MPIEVFTQQWNEFKSKKRLKELLDKTLTNKKFMDFMINSCNIARTENKEVVIDFKGIEYTLNDPEQTYKFIEVLNQVKY